MYLTQRLMGVSIYALCTICFCLLILKVKGLKSHLCIYCLLLALMGFFYVPLNGSDLGRVQLAMHALGNKNGIELIKEMCNSSTPLALLYYYLISFLGDDRMLPFINAILTYGLCFSLLVACRKKFNSSKRDIAIVLFFFMSRGLLMMTIANIRTMLSVSIVAFSIFKIMVEGKSFIKYIICMLIGALIHNVGMLTTMIFVGFYIIKGAKGRNKILTFCEGLLLISSGFIYGRFIILAAINKGITYLEYSQNGTNFFYFWEFLLSIIVIVFSIWAIYKYRKHTKGKNFEGKNVYFVERKKYVAFIEFQLLIAWLALILLFVEFNSGFRLSWLLTILDMPMLLIIFEDDIWMGYNSSNFKSILILISLGMLFVACARGDLCSLKFS